MGDRVCPLEWRLQNYHYSLDLSSVLACANTRLHGLRYRSQLVPGSILAHEVLSVPVADLRHIHCLAMRTKLTLKISVCLAVLLPSREESMGGRVADEDCESGADNHEEGHQCAVHLGVLSTIV